MCNDTPQPFHFQTGHSRWQGMGGNGIINNDWIVIGIIVETEMLCICGDAINATISQCL